MSWSERIRDYYAKWGHPVSPDMAYTETIRADWLTAEPGIRAEELTATSGSMLDMAHDLAREKWHLDFDSVKHPGTTRRTRAASSRLRSPSTRRS